MDFTPSLMLVLGTRPEVIKFAPVVRELDSRDHAYTVVHTGQHYSDSLDAVFFEQLDLREPEYNLGVGSQSHERQTGETMIRLEPIVETEDPNVLLVQGDTNSALAGALVAAKRDVRLGHVEAGLRSGERAMPEELNRILIDHAADYLFAPTNEARALLEQEGCGDRCVTTGNTVVDAVTQHASLAAERSDVLDELGLLSGKYAVLTAHRAENVDSPERFTEILNGVSEFAEQTDTLCVYPAHPRATDRLEAHGVTVPDEVRIVPPLDFLDFLELERNARVVFTDSGGVQEEACILDSPCVTLRDATERPESVAVGANVVAGTNAASITEAGVEMADTSGGWPCPFGDGEAARRIVDVIVGGGEETTRNELGGGFA